MRERERGRERERLHSSGWRCGDEVRSIEVGTGWGQTT